VITIVVERCTGCGACVEVCPSGALYLVDGKAAVDRAFCRACEDCLAACPSEAIILIAQGEPVAETVHVPALRPEPEIIQVGTPSASVSLRSRVLPVVGAALTWAWREIVPWLVDLRLDTLNRQATRPQARGGTRSHEGPATSSKGSGRQRRHRQRRGGGSR
jgi:NAD-dependent dihydropyrimidine dehydrogenase PreA subunit